MKIIFLDFDGPLVNHRTGFMQGGSLLTFIDPVAAMNILALCSKHDAKIVISSSWRYDHTAYSMRVIMDNAARGLGKCMHSVNPFTPRVNESCARGKEIQQWIDAQPEDVEAYAIVDDSSDLLLHQFKHYVHCDPYDGLDFAGCKIIDFLLRNEPIPGNVKQIIRERRTGCGPSLQGAQFALE